MDKFDITNMVLEALKKAGADRASATVSLGTTEELNAEDGELTLLRTITDKVNITMKVFVGNKIGTISIGSKKPSDIEKAAAQCVESAKYAKDDEAHGMNESGEIITFDSHATPLDMERLISRLNELLQAISAGYPDINSRSITLKHISGYEIYQNTYGTAFLNPVGYHNFNTMFMASKDNKVSSFNGASFAFSTPDLPFIEMGALDEKFDMSIKQVDAKPFGKKAIGTVIIAPQCLSVMLSHTLRAFLNDSSLISGSSRWRNALGTQVADKNFTLTAAPVDNRLVTGARFTDEGFATENQSIIENGFLNSLLANLYVSNKTGLPRALNSGGSLVLEKGEKTLDEIISTVEDGILMYRFSGGNPQASGDFSGIAKNSFIIKNGKITGAAKETTISGNLADMFMNIRAISSETVCDGSSIMPYAAFDGITIR